MSEEREEVKQGLKKKTFRPLYPVLVEKGTMNVLDGKTRKQSNPLWPEQEVEVKSPEDRLLIPMHGNYRRKVPKKETSAQMIGLANILSEQGVSKENMVSELAKITPYSEQHIRRLLPAKYKAIEKAHKIREASAPHPKIVTEQPSAPVVSAKPQSQAPRCPVCGELKTVMCPHCGRALQV